MASEVLANVKFIQEKKLIGTSCIVFLTYYCDHFRFNVRIFLLGKYFDEISQDTGKFCFGVGDTLKVSST